MMNVIKKIDLVGMPFDWLNLDSLPLSNCQKVEFDLLNQTDKLTEMGMLFFILFGKYKEDLVISNGVWGDFCLDSWDINQSEFGNKANQASTETIEYLKLLKDSNVELGYNGLCECSDWNCFLKIVLACIISHIAPYSPLFHNKLHQITFYFHHSGSIGLFYKEKNDVINDILSTALDNNLKISYRTLGG